MLGSDFKTNISCCPPGTPVSDTVCGRCPHGHFSSSSSSSELCHPHRNCSDFGLKTLRWGTSTSDSLCGPQDRKATLECSQHHALCRNGENLQRAEMLLIKCSESLDFKARIYLTAHTHVRFSMLYIA